MPSGHWDAPKVISFAPRAPSADPSGPHLGAAPSLIRHCSPFPRVSFVALFISLILVGWLVGWFVCLQASGKVAMPIASLLFFSVKPINFSLQLPILLLHKTQNTYFVNREKKHKTSKHTFSPPCSSCVKLPPCWQKSDLLISSNSNQKFD